MGSFIGCVPVTTTSSIPSKSLISICSLSATAAMLLIKTAMLLRFSMDLSSIIVRLLSLYKQSGEVLYLHPHEGKYNYQSPLHLPSSPLSAHLCSTEIASRPFKPGKTCWIVQACLVRFCSKSMNTCLKNHSQKSLINQITCCPT